MKLLDDVVAKVGLTPVPLMPSRSWLTRFPYAIDDCFARYAKVCDAIEQDITTMLSCRREALTNSTSSKNIITGAIIINLSKL